jgi:hypothetical protein
MGWPTKTKPSQQFTYPTSNPNEAPPGSNLQKQTSMDDLQQSNPFSGILTPQALAALRQQQFEQLQQQASSPFMSGANYAARMGGLGIGRDLGMAGGGNSPLDQSANQNAAILSDNSSAPAPTGDIYADRASLLEAKAAQFQQAGRPDIAMQLGAAAMQARQMGLQFQRQQGQADVEAGKAAEQKASAQYVVVDSAPDSSGIPTYKRYGDSIALYGDDGKVDPNFQQNYQSAIAAAKAAGATSPTLMRAADLENSKANAAAIRAQATLGAAALRGTGQQSVIAQDEGTLNQFTGAYALNGMSALSRLPAADRAAVLKNATAKGLTYQDMAEAKLQYAALQHAINTGATRAGQVAFLSNEIPGQAANVAQALAGVDRTRIQALNGLIASGKQEFGDPGESRYAVALNGLITPYSRLIAGATGQTTDAARDEALKILSNQQSPDQVKAVLDQIVNRELVVAKQAGEGVIEMARNSSRYSALAKIAEKLGVPASSMAGDQAGADAGGLSAPPLGGSVPGAAFGFPTATATGPGGAKLYLVNGQWTANPSTGGPQGTNRGASGSF